jgi:hypothetical protein
MLLPPNPNPISAAISHDKRAVSDPTALDPVGGDLASLHRVGVAQLKMAQFSCHTLGLQLIGVGERDRNSTAGRGLQLIFFGNITNPILPAISRRKKWSR